MADVPQSAYQGLRRRLKAFVRAYVETGVGTKALKAIGFTGKRPDVAACKLMAKPTVRAAIVELEATLADEMRARVVANVRGLEHIANFDPLLAKKPLEEWPEEARLAVQGIDVEEWYEDGGEKPIRIVIKKYRTASKIEARKLIMQFQRVLVNQHEHAGPNGGPIPVRSVDELTDEQLEAIARAGIPAPAKPTTSAD